MEKKGFNPLFVLIPIFVIALGCLFYLLSDYVYADVVANQASDLKDEFITMVEIEEMLSVRIAGNDADESDEPPITEEKAETLKKAFTKNTDNNKLARLFVKYSDFRGWVSIPNTKIDNAVVQGKDNDFYLHRGMNKKYLRLGTVFADFRNSFDGELSDNTVLYGHHVVSGSYFSNLVKYKDHSFYKKHKFVTFDTLDNSKKWVIIGAFMPNIKKDQDREPLFQYSDYIDFSDEAMFNDYMSQVTKRSYFNTDIDVRITDKFLTLSTCDYEFEDARFVVVARQLRADESTETMRINSRVNENRYMPDVWYDVKRINRPR